MRSLLPLAAVALLAACGQGSPPAPAPTASAAVGGYVAKVAALPARQRAGVLLRAIRDANQPCQQVVEQQAVPGTGGGVSWLATCEDRNHWVVAIGDDGTATVADARDVRRQQPR